MANEDILRKKWRAIYEATDEYQNAKKAAALDQAKREAKYKLLKQSAKNAFELAEITQKQRAEEGTGPGEVALKAADYYHNGRVEDYINKTAAEGRQRAMFQPVSMGAEGPNYRTEMADPDFANHAPWATVQNQSLAPSALVDIEKDRVNRNGGTWTPAEDLYAAVAAGAKKEIDRSRKALGNASKEAEDVARAASVADENSRAGIRAAARNVQRNVIIARTKGAIGAFFDPLDAKDASMVPPSSQGGMLRTGDGQNYRATPNGPRRVPDVPSVTAVASVQSDMGDPAAPIFRGHGAGGTWEDAGAMPDAAPPPQEPPAPQRPSFDVLMPGEHYNDNPLTLSRSFVGLGKSIGNGIQRGSQYLFDNAGYMEKYYPNDPRTVDMRKRRQAFEEKKPASLWSY